MFSNGGNNAIIHTIKIYGKYQIQRKRAGQFR